MAANEDRTALWRTPLSTPVRRNENGFQDLFKHSEKLLASAVSICRLKGSVECQTGGIITVCEEMQRLLRLAFNETGRLEKELKKQKQTYDEEISLLKERLSYLEETKEMPLKTKKNTNNERLPLKLSTAENTLQGDVPKKTPIRIYKVQTNKTTERKSPECQLANENTDQNIHEEEQQHNGTLDKTNEQDKPTEEQDNMTEENESEDLSLEVSVFDILKETKAKANNKKASGNKRSQDSSSAKTRKSSTKKTIFSEELKGVDKPNQESKSKESRAKKRLSSKRHEENISENDASVSADVVFDANDSGHSDIFLNPESGLLEMKESSDPEVSEQEENPKKNPKKKVTKDKANSLNDEKKAKKDPKPKKTVRKQPPKQRKESPKSATMEAIVTVITESPNSSPLRVLPKSPVKKTPGKIVDDTVSKSNLPTPKSSPQVSTNEPDDFLGDMGFLIDMSSMISSFVSSESQQIELPLMQARERSDARKLVALFNLHISIGNKSDNRSSLILSKTSNSQMPKPGKLDNLLSKLSIAAAKEAERLSSKARTKRKFASIGDDASLSDTDSQPKRAGKSKNKKAKM